MRGLYDEAYVIRFGADSGEGEMDGGKGRWFEEGTDEDDFIEDCDHEYGLMMETEYNMLKLIPYFDSENASRMSGKVSERWCLSSRLTDFETLKRRFYNRFIRLTKEQLLQRLLDAAQEHDELVDDWGRRISRYCDEARLFKETLRGERSLQRMKESVLVRRQRVSWIKVM
ncbi:hypothetical protein PF004_g15913 [Phytophthora fragariae]|uniref:Uncharacterized protein n=1 Tax=Phytophthora fragariae TaxID=53985 RepID=A0A6G0NJX4_9STRA|nr:hypothetical protein PF004_g15913 [Phytophthora fragariae]